MIEDDLEDDEGVEPEDDPATSPEPTEEPSV